MTEIFALYDIVVVVHDDLRVFIDKRSLKKGGKGPKSKVSTSNKCTDSLRDVMETGLIQCRNMHIALSTISTSITNLQKIDEYRVCTSGSRAFNDEMRKYISCIKEKTSLLDRHAAQLHCKDNDLDRFKGMLA